MIQDLKFAFRQLWKSPGFTLAAVVVLALGIGVNTAIFSFVQTMLFDPPAYPRPKQVVQIFSQDKKNPATFRAFSYPTYVDIRDQNTVFQGVLAHVPALVGLGENGNTRRTLADVVSANYFSVLGVAPRQGRMFLPEEEKPGNASLVAIVSYNYWKKQGFSSTLVGEKLLINSRPFTIIGIMPEGFTGLMPVAAFDVWLPLGVHGIVASAEDESRGSLAQRSANQLLLIGRLKEGVSPAAAQPALTTLAANLEQQFPVEQKDQTFITARLSRFAMSTGPSRDGAFATVSALLFSMAAVVLLVAGLNLANMLMARGTARRREIAIRLALGASRPQIVRQLLTEGFVLSLIGGACGLILALWSADLLIAALGATMPGVLVWKTGPNAILLAATFGFCALCTIFFALGPAVKLSRSAALADLKLQAGDDTRRRRRFLPRNPLLIGQIALSLALLTAAALFIRGAIESASVETGLQANDTFLVEVDASFAGNNQSRTREIYTTLTGRFASLPGVRRASISATVPFGTMSIAKHVQRAGINPSPNAATAAEGRAFLARWNSVGADYFATVGLPIRQGRAFTAEEANDATGPAVAIIDEVLARQLWPEGSALGQLIQFAQIGPLTPEEKTALTSGDIRPGESVEVVGIVPVTRSAIFGDTGGAIYLPFGRGFQNSVFFYVNTPALAGENEATTADLLRRTVRSVDPTLPILSLKSFRRHLDDNFELHVVRMGAGVFSVFGLLALGLAAVGIYGVNAYSVARRTREFGIRMALGAQRGTVQRMILKESFVLLATGLILGLALSAATGKILSGFLYNVAALDPAAFLVAPAVLTAAVLVATWLPSRRATRVNPIEALRAE